jgi:DnaJ-class molecular chaperone
MPLDPDLIYEECPACDGAGFRFDELGLPDSVCEACDGEGYVVHGCAEVVA